MNIYKMKTRSQANQSFSVKEVEAVKALMQLKMACNIRPQRTCTLNKIAVQPTSQRPRRAVANYHSLA